MIGFDWQSMFADLGRIIAGALLLYFVPYLVRSGWVAGGITAEVKAKKIIEKLAEQKVKAILASNEKKDDDKPDLPPPDRLAV